MNWNVPQRRVACERKVCSVVTHTRQMDTNDGMGRLNIAFSPSRHHHRRKTVFGAPPLINGRRHKWEVGEILNCRAGEIANERSFARLPPPHVGNELVWKESLGSNPETSFPLATERATPVRRLGIISSSMNFIRLY